MGSAHVVPRPELLPIYDNIISFAFRDALYALSVRLTQKYVHQAKRLTRPSELRCLDRAAAVELAADFDSSF